MKMKNSLPSVIVECILPVHAFFVSRVYFIEKGKESLNKILESKKMQVCLRKFNNLTRKTFKRPQLKETAKNYSLSIL